MRQADRQGSSKLEKSERLVDKYTKGRQRNRHPFRKSGRKQTVRKAERQKTLHKDRVSLKILKGRGMEIDRQTGRQSKKQEEKK